VRLRPLPRGWRRWRKRGRRRFCSRSSEARASSRSSRPAARRAGGRAVAPMVAAGRERLDTFVVLTVPAIRQFSRWLAAVSRLSPEAGRRRGPGDVYLPGRAWPTPAPPSNPGPPRTARGEGPIRLRRSSRSSDQAFCQCELLRTAFRLRLPRGRRRRGQGDAKNCPRRSAWPTRRRCRSPPAEAAGHERDGRVAHGFSTSSRQGRDCWR
jgi:hypothetical protein